MERGRALAEGNLIAAAGRAAPDDVGAARFAAFISYRHIEPDRSWARWLHRALETYRVPARLARERGLPRRVGRIFRDEEELSASADLSRSIDEALFDSKFLIVVCSPRTPASRWVNREVERFREWGRHDQILALLIEGEPTDSFPRALREIRRTITDGATTLQQLEEVEPLAADVRPQRPTERRRAGRGHAAQSAKLRLLAQLLQVRFDDLRRREQERRNRRLAIIGAVTTTMALLMTLLAVEAVAQRDRAIRGEESADQRRREAEHARELARTAQGRAEDAGHLAEAQRKVAESRLADSLLAQADTMAAGERWADAGKLYHEARTALLGLQRSTLPADIGLARTGLSAPPPLARLVGHAAPVTTTALSSNSRRAASGAADGSIAVWDLLTGQRIAAMPPRRGSAVTALAFAPIENRLLAGYEDGAVTVWELQRNDKATSQATPPAPRDVAHFNAGSKVLCIAWSPDGRRIAAGMAHAAIGWDVATAQMFPRYTEFDGWMTSIAFSPDGATCIGAARELIHWDLATGKSIVWLGRAGVNILTTAMCPDAHYCVAAGAVNSEAAISSIWLCDLQDRPQVRSIGTYRADVLNVAVASSGANVISAARDGTVRRWDLPSGRESGIARGSDGPLEHVAISSDGRLATSGGRDGALRLWPIEKLEPPMTTFRHPSLVTSIAIAPDGRLAVTGCNDGRLRLWDVATGQLLWSQARFSRAINCVAFAPDGQRIAAAASDDRMAILLHIARSEKDPPVRLPLGRLDNVRTFLFSPDGKRLIIGSGNHVELFDVENLETGGDVAALPAPARRPAKMLRDVRAFGTLAGGLALRAPASSTTGAADDSDAVGITVHGGLVAIGLRAGLAIPFPGTLANRLELSYSVTFWPDLSRFIGGSGNDAVICSAVDRRELKRLVGHTGEVIAAAVSDDGALAATGSADRSIKLWDPETGRDLCTLDGHRGSVQSLAFSSASAHPLVLLSGSDDCTARTWDLGFAARCRVMSAQASDAMTALQHARDDRSDAADLATVGAWYALRGQHAWAIEMLSRARAGGADVPALLLARCHWQLGQLEQARTELRSALARREAPDLYLQVCLNALNHPAPAPTTEASVDLPATRPAATQPAP